MDGRNSFFGSIKGSIKSKLSRSATGSSKMSSTDKSASIQPQPAAASNPFVTVSTPPQVSSNEPPPAYSVVPRDVSPTSSRLSRIQASTPEDPYAFLTSFDTIFLIDDSGSMVGRSWREVRSALASITPICTAHDADGIDVYFLNHRSPSVTSRGKAAGGYTNVTNEASVTRLFNRVQPSGMTPMGTRLNHILKAYLRHYEEGIARARGDPDDTDVKPINIIVITDGVPSDDPESALLNAAQKLDKLEAPPHQVGVQFFQVGNEEGAAEALRILDDELSNMGGGVRDMVDTVTFNVRPGAGATSSTGLALTMEGGVPVLSADGILKTVLGAVVKRLDRSKLEEEERRSMRSGRLRP